MPDIPAVPVIPPEQVPKPSPCTAGAQVLVVALLVENTQVNVRRYLLQQALHIVCTGAETNGGLSRNIDGQHSLPLGFAVEVEAIVDITAHP